MPELSRAAYADLFGPAAGDRIRLADTDLLIEIEEDRSGGPGLAGGSEAVFGGGKVIRESMGQSRATRAEGAPDTVVTGVVIVDHYGGSSRPTSASATAGSPASARPETRTDDGTILTPPSAPDRDHRGQRTLSSPRVPSTRTST